MFTKRAHYALVESRGGYVRSLSDASARWQLEKRDHVPEILLEKSLLSHAPTDAQPIREFRVILIKPSRYDEDGYVLQWWRSAAPSNSLAALFGLVEDCAERKILGETVSISATAYDETNAAIRPERIARELSKPGVAGLVCLVGVQSNQYPRALDLGRAFVEAGAKVCIGGFHVSGSLNMLPGIQPELAEAMDAGISLFAGEAEGRLDSLLRDAFENKLQPLYRGTGELPELPGYATPLLPSPVLQRTFSGQASFDAGRGCPFQCSFCTIINVQGRKSRSRSPDDVEAIIREHAARGIRKFFITDDNFARNKDWEAIFDRLISLRYDHGLKVKLTIQVDTLCHKIPNFIEKAEKAGVKKVFIGMETINAASLKAAKKRQNQLSEYLVMLQAWKKIRVITYAGYILGFPGDTPESIEADVKLIQRELPIDILEFFNLTPLPGSEDHQKLFNAGVAMDSDLNRYDADHVTTAHPLMSREDWERGNELAWRTYYSWPHIETLLRRAHSRKIKTESMARMILWFHGTRAIENIHPLEGGAYRRRRRLDRRSSLPIESPLRFYPKRAAEVVTKLSRFAWLYMRLEVLRHRVEREARHTPYVDNALDHTRDGSDVTLAVSQMAK